MYLSYSCLQDCKQFWPGEISDSLRSIGRNGKFDEKAVFGRICHHGYPKGHFLASSMARGKFANAKLVQYTNNMHVAAVHVTRQLNHNLCCPDKIKSVQ